MIEQILDLFSTYVASYGYVVLFFVTLFENSIFLGAFMPGETFAFLSGYYAGQGILNPYLAVLLLFLGSAIGDNIGFTLGRHKGKKWLEKIGSHFGYREEKIERAEQFWKDHGGKSIFTGRFIAVARTFVPFLAGASRVERKVFLKYDLSGALLWAILHVALGFFFGSYFKLIKGLFGGIGIIFFLVFGIVMYKYIVKKSMEKAEAKGGRNANRKKSS